MGCECQPSFDLHSNEQCHPAHCSAGLVAELAAKAVAPGHVIGIDISPGMLAQVLLDSLTALVLRVALTLR